MKKSRLLGAVCACVFTLAVSSAHAVVYSLIDLGTLGGDTIFVHLCAGRLD